ncbi:MAG: CbtA family protein [Hyphomicrobiales bacterium]|nr:CbtA family protein [Hyphomicrobiales bacterium]MCP5374149.1 CbtA family protein [Hyphomicrobiales bacterium]
MLTAALVAGVLGGVVASAVQAFTTIPLIHLAEAHEDGGGGAAAPAAGQAAPDHGTHDHGAQDHGTHDHGAAAAGHDHGANAWMPAEGVERVAYTVLANVIAGVGFALILVACFVLHGAPMDGRRGVVWGMAGFTAFALAPSLGLPPELPGMFAAELVARQTWWFAAALGTAAGLWLMVFGNAWAWRVVGMAVLVAPHFWVPHPEGMGGGPPPELSAHFVTASLATAAVFWAVLGWVGGTVHRRLAA